jgi:hypothetical protein
MTFLRLQDLHDFKDIIATFRILGDASETAFTRCAVAGAIDGLWGFGIEGVVTLQDVGRDQNLVPLLSFFEGHTLEITNCPSFDDLVLAAMGTWKNGALACAPAVYSLSIHSTDNPTFSVTALKRLVDIKLAILPNTGGLSYGRNSGRFELLRVSGNAPYLSHEDRAWFTERVPQFSYP